MILTFESAAFTSAGSAALALPSIVALAAYLVAALFGRQGEGARRGDRTLLAGAGEASVDAVDAADATARVAAWCRASIVVAWVAHAIAIAIDASAVGAAVSGGLAGGISGGISGGLAGGLDAGSATAQVNARFGFAPALSVTIWLVVAVYLIESRFLPLVTVRRTLAMLGASAVALAWVFPGEILTHLASRWIPLHWVMGIASYGLFGAAVLHAALLNRADRQMRIGPRAGNPSPASLGLPLLRLERLTFRFVGAGFIVLTIAIVLGWYFADPWRWDHKSIFSILGWAVFAALLAGRRAFGWRGRHATRWLYTGAGLLLLAYVGSRFVLEVILHKQI